MPLQTPQRKNSELTRINVRTKFLPSSITNRLFFLEFMGLIRGGVATTKVGWTLSFVDAWL
jgi:hypothetical protein